MKKLITLLIIAAAVLVGVHAFGPKTAEVALHYALSQKMDLKPEDVRVEASPGMKVLLGELDAVSVHGKAFRVGGLMFDSFDCDLQGVKFSPMDALLDQQMTLASAAHGEMSASVSSNELRNFLVEKVDGLKDVSVVFLGDTIEVSGSAKLGGLLNARAVIHGRFGMDEKKLMFIPDDVTVEGFGMKYRARGLGSAEVYDFSEFPLGIVPDSVTMHGDVLTIHGQTAAH